VAEVVPVSSSAQLTLLPWLLRWEQPEDRTTFAAALHAGSCLGLTVALRRDLTTLDRRTAKLVLLTSLPAAAAGLLAQDAVERRLGRPGPTPAPRPDSTSGASSFWIVRRRRSISASRASSSDGPELSSDINTRRA